MAGKKKENRPKIGNSSVMNIGKRVILDKNFKKIPSYLFLDI